MNLDFRKEKYRFQVRASALIYNNTQDKILLFKVEEKDYYLLPGGRIEEKENSLEAIKREIKEELNWNIKDFTFLSLSEEFVGKNHQINIIYKTVVDNKIDIESFKGIEGEWINFKWVDIKDIDQYTLYPSSIKNILKDPNKKYHSIENIDRNINILE